jgi:hypothetical protein
MNELQPALLVLIVGLAASAARRLLVSAGADGARMVLAVIVCVAGFGVMTVQLLSAVGLAGNPWAELALAALLWLGVAKIVPRPPPLTPVVPTWASGGLIGMYLTASAWCLANPVRSFDGMTYHSATPLGWVDAGSVFARVDTLYDFPTYAYPAVNEMLLTWACGAADSLVPLALWPPFASVILVLAGVVGLREIGVPAWASILAPTTVVLCVIAVRQITAPNTDLIAVAWLAAGGALIACRRT